MRFVLNTGVKRTECVTLDRIEYSLFCKCLVPTTHSPLLATGLHHADALSFGTRADALPRHNFATDGEDASTGTKAITLCVGATWDRAIVTRTNGFAAWVLPLALGVVRSLGAAEGQRKQLGIAHRHTDLNVLER